MPRSLRNSGEERHVERFNKGIGWEVRWLKELTHRHIAHYYGSCDDDKVSVTCHLSRATCHVSDTPPAVALHCC